jgi:transposase-like protein
MREVKKVDERTRQCMLAALATGQVTVAEVARYCDVTHQAVSHWCFLAGIEAVRMRDSYVADYLAAFINGDRQASKAELVRLSKLALAQRKEI